MQILAFFTNNGSPATGLSPTIRIREIPAGTLVVTDAAMTEIGDGHYSYEFTGYSVSKDYAIRCDGGATLSGSERYTYAGNENYIDDIDWTIDRNTTLLGVSGDIVSVSAAVKENYQLIQTVNTNVLGVSADVIVVDQKIDSVQLDISNILNNVGAVSAAVWAYDLDQAPSAAAGGVLKTTSYLGSVWIDTQFGKSGTDYPIGTPGVPSDNLADARTIADNLGLRSFVLRGSITLDQAYERWDFRGIGGDFGAAVIALNGQNITGSQFTECALSGTQNGRVNSWRCGLQNIVDCDGVFNQAVLDGFIRPADSAEVYLLGCWSGVAGINAPIIDFVNAGTNGAEINLRQYSGGIDIRNITNANSRISAEFVAGQIKIRDTNTTGTIAIRGVTKITNESSGPQIITEAALSRTPIANEVWTHQVTAGKPGSAEDYLVNVSAGIRENYELIQTVNTNVIGVSADVLVVDGKIDSVQLDVDSIQSDVLRNYTQILSLSASNQENFNEVNTNILGVSASLEDITVSAAGANEVADAVWSKTLSSGQTAEQILINNSNDLKRLLGLTHENIYIDQPVYDGDNNLTSARVRIYDSAANVGTATGVIGTYQITAPGAGPGKFTTWKQVRSS